MGARETTVPLRRRLIVCAALVCWALVLPAGTSAQYPTDLNWCAYRSNPTCFELGGGPLIIALCPMGDAFFKLYFGRTAWYPLRCVGPITVSVLTFSGSFTRFPLYVEVVPLSTASADACGNLPGKVVLPVYGQSYISAPCGAWDEAGPIDITNFVSIGSLYALRLYFFSNLAGFSPALGCIRVTAHPIDTTAVLPTLWGQVKALYK